jgi:hypothetical protein
VGRTAKAVQDLGRVHVFICIYLKPTGFRGTLSRAAFLAAKDRKGPVPEKEQNITELNADMIPRDRWLWVRLGQPVEVPPGGIKHLEFRFYEHNGNWKRGMYISHVDIVPEYEISDEALAATDICLTPPRFRAPSYLPAANKLG